jgi:hypothetical protein
MDSVALIDIVTTLFFAGALFYALMYASGTSDRQSAFFLVCAMGVYVLVGISNILEHAGITAYFDRYEDHLEILFIPFFLFFLFSRQMFLELNRRMAAEEGVRQLNLDLERRVLERTSELDTANHALEASNQDLESFCYSVSHDLRTPLRSIAGYSSILAGEYGESLDERGRHYLGRMGRSAAVMGELIDALLELSRVARREMQLTRIDLSAACSSIASQLKEAHPDRSVKLHIQEDIWVAADSVLILQVLQNLLENAWKYTAPVSTPVIEFGRREIDGETVYFVRDNGVGFNMEYANKLFLPFQRLHAATEFEGTGIGLATVQRIIGRHGGRVWAEGKVGDGSAFFFTLGE